MVDMTRVNFDRSGQVVDTVIGGVKGHFNLERFIEGLNYPFEDTYLIAYEPLRNVYVVERFGGNVVSGQDLPEIQWVENNLQNIVDAIPTHSFELVFKETVEMHRSLLLSTTDWLVTRHSEQKMLGIPTTLTDQQFITLTNYRQALRDITNSCSPNDEFNTIVWPTLEL